MGTARSSSALRFARNDWEVHLRENMFQLLMVRAQVVQMPTQLWNELFEFCERELAAVVEPLRNVSGLLHGPPLCEFYEINKIPRRGPPTIIL